MIESEEQLEEMLSRPSPADVAATAALDGDLMLLGVGGKMGPSLARLARRACDGAGIRKRILGVSRFSTPGLAEELERAGIEPVSCDLLDRAALLALPDVPNIIFMTGRKFGSTGQEWLTWAMNTLAPAMVAERFYHSRFVAFSSGNVYPLMPVGSGGPTESDPTGPVGEYAQSALGRERMFEYFSEKHGTPVVILRLNYAIDLRYGVLHDVAQKVFARRPIDLAMGYANVIWQRDANSVALRAFAHCQSPALVLNLTGPEIISIRRVACRFGEIFGIEPVFCGTEADTALLSNAALCHRMFGPPEASLEQMIAWIAHWVKIGGRSLDKPTHYEQRDGRF
ncbi:MAG: NAD-dependent epimerase/dehydratase family protein [Acidobacteria bacterium]|nr:NAD-dependent epimerase/dehydratase family protein [Acidobacteriota bacterium]